MKRFAVAAAVLSGGLIMSAGAVHAMAPVSTGFAAVSDAPIVHVAHAGEPYKNVDKRNDAGNDTGDSQVDRLNDESLQKARQK